MEGYIQEVHPCLASLLWVENTRYNQLRLSEMRFLSVLFLLEMSAQHIILPVILIDKRDNDSIVIFFFLKMVEYIFLKRSANIFTKV